MSTNAKGGTGNIPRVLDEIYGAFSPRFYGISLILGTFERFQAFGARTGIFGVESAPRLPKFEEICLATALAHETRHFHDALISPYANRLMMIRLSCTFNALGLFRQLSRTSANCLPVPLMRWAAMSRTERDCWLRELTCDPPPDMELPIRPVSMPDALSFHAHEPGYYQLSRERDPESLVAEFAEAVMADYHLTATLMDDGLGTAPEDPEFQSLSADERRFMEIAAAPANLFEANALAVQLQAATWEMDDNSAAVEFGRQMLTSEHPYANIYSYIAVATLPPGTPRSELLSTVPTRVCAVATWCLLGNPFDCNPSIRLMQLGELLADHGIPEVRPVATLWDEWDARLGFPSWRVEIAEMRARTQRSLERYSAAVEKGERHAEDIVTILKSYADDQRVATDFLLSDPDAYVHVADYISRGREALPNPILSIEAGSEDFSIGMDGPPISAASIRYPGIFQRDGKYIWRRMVIDLQKPLRVGLLDAVLSFENRCKAYDVAINGEGFKAIEREHYLSALAQHFNWKPVNVF